nr:unnamed protein product [Callosobruchus analis]
MTKGGSTKELHKHFNAIHEKKIVQLTQVPVVKANVAVSDAEVDQIVVVNEEDSLSSSFMSHSSQNSQIVPKRRKLTDYYLVDPNHEDNSLDAILARMAALDGLPFRVFIKSRDLRKGLEARGFTNLPTSSSTIKNIISLYCEKIFDNFAKEIKVLRQKGRCFSLTFDEWTSTANKRFLNINIHGILDEQCGKIWNIGLVRAQGSMPAEICINLVESKLKRFGLSLKDDIVSVTTDGASVMMKLGKLIQPLHQLCFARGIQLAVIAIMYSKNKKTSEQNFDNDGDDGHDSSDEDDYDNDIDNIAEEGLLEIVKDEPVALDLMNDENINALVTEVRKIVKLFRRSPLKNNVLQNYVKDKHSKELNLILDCKTRWSSLAQMLQRFIFVKDCIKKTMIDLSMPMNLSDYDFEVLEQVSNCLEPIRLTVLALCRCDANLYTADASFKFMFEELSKIDIPFSRDLQTALKHRINERRTLASSVLSYLCNPVDYMKTVEGPKDSLFDQPDTIEILKFMKNWIKRLTVITSIQTLQEDDEKSDQDEDDEVPLSHLSESYSAISLAEKLNRVIENAISTSTGTVPISLTANANELTKTLKGEMTLFESGGSRGRNLQLC